LAFVGAVDLYPLYRRMVRLRAEAYERNTERQVREALLPLHVETQGLVQRTRPTSLPMPRQTRLPLSELGLVRTAVRQRATAAGLEVLGIVPRLDTLKASEERIPFDISMTGDLQACRQFLIDLVGLAYTDHVQRVRITPEEGAPGKRRILVQVWFAFQARPADTGRTPG
jgi:hypothetical protein